MTEEHEAGQPEPERYYAEHLTPSAGGENLSIADIQEAINAGSRQSWHLVGVVNEPSGQGMILVWDQAVGGFISG